MTARATLKLIIDLTNIDLVTYKLEVKNMKQENKRELTMNIVFNVLFWGALWGIVEATLGTILHLPLFETAGIYGKSSVIIIPIAYCLMANCYKKTNSFYAVFLMGVVAALIKLPVGFFIGFIDRVYFPALYIVLEALAMGSALAIFRPKDVLSLKTFVAIVVANTVYQFSYLCVASLNGSRNVFASYEAWQTGAEKYLFTINCIAILYSLAIGAAAFGIIKLVKKTNPEFKFNLNKLIHSPIAVSVLVGLSLVSTVALALI